MAAGGRIYGGRSAAGLARRDRGFEFMRWGLSFAAVAAIQGALVVGYLAHDTPPPANEAPEAAIMIDLPPELALPPAESVESVASSAAEEVEAPEATEPPPPDAVETPAEDAPAEAVEDMPEIDLSELPPPEEVEALAEEALPETPAEELAAAAEPEAVEAVPPDEVVVSEVAPPPPPKPRAQPRPKPPAKPKPPVREARPARTAEPATPRRQQASRASVAGQRASGAGAPDKNALTRFMSGVRAAIMRQERSVSGQGGGRTATVSFTISASGALGGISVSKSSGDPALDAAAVAMVRRASPVGPIPAGVGRSSVQSRIPVRFD
ncbi:energy transducer TonB family protein [Aureimonas leprariae]|uniref:Energy transducer TonB n=1 Tax=Plantimonas leprariae TaxID=2615207 RepID=A0A7V7PLE8_9HYPH|nr:energy transducer TonB [Aureimonas leprariae]KAB0677214.1 energy transducer TonB [Aureimonas leprariae]